MNEVACWCITSGRWHSLGPIYTRTMIVLQGVWGCVVGGGVSVGLWWTVCGGVYAWHWRVWGGVGGRLRPSPSARLRGRGHVLELCRVQGEAWAQYRQDWVHCSRSTAEPVF